MTKRNGPVATAWFWSSMLIAGGSLNAAHAADLAWPPAPVAVYPGPVYGYDGFPVVDPRCRIIPIPQANLFGDTARFRPTAVCQSRGLYADSVLFP